MQKKHIKNPNDDSVYGSRTLNAECTEDNYELFTTELLWDFVLHCKFSITDSSISVPMTQHSIGVRYCNQHQFIQKLFICN